MKWRRTGDLQRSPAIKVCCMLPSAAATCEFGAGNGLCILCLHTVLHRFQAIQLPSAFVPYSFFPLAKITNEKELCKTCILGSCA